MKIYRKTCTMFLNFNNKIIVRVIFGKTSKNFIKAQVSGIRLDDGPNI